MPDLLRPGVRALVTGASGFVGANVVRALLARGVGVRGLVRLVRPVRNGGARLALDGLPIECAVGDVRDAGSVRRALRGVSVCFHVAADYRLFVRDPDELVRSNVLGTRTVLEECRKAGVARVVHTSSVAAVAVPEDRPGTEADLLRPEDAPGAYKRSKVLSELEARSAASRGVPVVIVNPAAPFGPWDSKPTPTGRIVLDFLRRRMPAYVDTGLCPVDVRDVAEGHLLAAERGAVGERYILGDRNMTLREILEMLAVITGLRAPRVRLPMWVALLAAVADEWIRGRLLGGEPRATVDAIRMARKKMFFDSSRARRELGWTTRPVEEAFRSAVDWFREHGYVR